MIPVLFGPARRRRRGYDGPASTVRPRDRCRPRGRPTAQPIARATFRSRPTCLQSSTARARTCRQPMHPDRTCPTRRRRPATSPAKTARAAAAARPRVEPAGRRHRRAARHRRHERRPTPRGQSAVHRLRGHPARQRLARRRASPSPTRATHPPRPSSLFISDPKPSPCIKDTARNMVLGPGGDLHRGLHLQSGRTRRHAADGAVGRPAAAPGPSSS